VGVEVTDMRENGYVREMRRKVNQKIRTGKVSARRGA